MQRKPLERKTNNPSMYGGGGAFLRAGNSRLLCSPGES